MVSPAGSSASSESEEVGGAVESVSASADSAAAFSDSPPLRGEPSESLRSVATAIPWRYRLSTKLLAVSGALTIAMIGAFTLAEIQIQKQLLAEVVRGLALFSETVKNATHRAMREDRRADAYDMMATIGRQEEIEKIRILNKEGRVTFSTDAEEIGALVDKKAEACYGCHEAGRPLSRISAPSRSRIFTRDRHRVMGMVTPIYNEPSCATSACHVHPPGKQVLGVLDVSVSLADVDEHVLAFRRSTQIITAMGVILLAWFFYFFAKAQMVRPVADLVVATRRVARDQLDHEIPVRSKGELGLLAASFNEMTRSLRRAEGELRALNENLEHEVEERTADLKSAQGQLVQAEKLTSLGKLSASIAHEINNPLAGILTFSKLLIRTIEEGPLDESGRRTVIKNLQLVRRETERCSAIVRNLLDFARERPLALKEVNVNAVVDEVLFLIANQIQIQGVVLEKSVEEVPLVAADFGQLRQAFVNIALNACEVMPKGGKLTISTRAAPSGFVEVGFTDTGPGIAPEHLTKIFDPFFTTKEKGTGLGLSVVYGIVQRHGGNVEVHSEPAKGARFVIRLPVAGGGDRRGEAG